MTNETLNAIQLVAVAGGTLAYIKILNQSRVMNYTTREYEAHYQSIETSNLKKFKNNKRVIILGVAFVLCCLWVAWMIGDLAVHLRTGQTWPSRIIFNNANVK